MGSSPPPSHAVPPVALALVAALALTSALAGCGGGTAGAPLAGTSAVASTAAARPATPAPAGGTATARTTAPAPRTTAPAPRTTAPAPRTTAPAPRPPAHPRAASAPRPAPAAPRTAAAAPRTTTIDELADLTLTRRAGLAHYFQAGSVTGTYAGTMAVEARITSRGVLVRFTATLPGGTIAGHALAVAILDSATWPGLRGNGEIDSGTGRFAGIRGRGLRLSGRARPDASRARVRLTGTVSF